MSSFIAPRDVISKVYSHPNADKLELARVSSLTFQFCVGKGTFKVGDEVVYFPVDSVLPLKVIEHFGIGQYLTGKQKNRIKTARLRGEISQGYVERLSKVMELLPGMDTPTDFMEPLGIVKYEPPEVPCKNGTLSPHPFGVHKYDIEGCDNFPEVVERISKMKVSITEKCEGSNFYASIQPDGEIVVGQRNHQVKPDPTSGGEHTWWAVAKRQGIIDALPWLKAELGVSNLAVRGEVCGPAIQGNIYNLNTPTLFVFDILAGTGYVSFDRFMELCKKYNFQTVPVIASDVYLPEWLNGRTLQQASNGESALFKTLREGIVIKPTHETVDTDLGVMNHRLILKQRDPIYLAQSKD